MVKPKLTPSRLALVLILNVFVLPGLGSLLGGKIVSGIVEIALFVGGIFLVLAGRDAGANQDYFFAGGLAMVFVGWIGMVLTTVTIFAEALKKPKAPKRPPQLNPALRKNPTSWQHRSRDEY